MQYVLIADLARQWLFENGEQTDHKFVRANYHATQGAKRLQLHVLRQPTPARLPVQANKTVQLPADCVQVLKVGLVRGDEVISLTVFPGLPRDRAAGSTGNPGTTQALPPAGLSPALGSHGYDPYQWWGSQYGAPTNFNAAGHYLLDRTSNLLLLAEDVPADDRVYVEYLTSGVTTKGTDQVPLAAEQALICYVNWQMAEKQRGLPVAEKQRLQEEYKRQVRLLSVFNNRTTKKNILEALNRGFSRTVK